MSRVGLIWHPSWLKKIRIARFSSNIRYRCHLYWTQEEPCLFKSLTQLNFLLNQAWLLEQRFISWSQSQNVIEKNGKFGLDSCSRQFRYCLVQVHHAHFSLSYIISSHSGMCREKSVKVSQPFDQVNTLHVLLQFLGDTHRWTHYCANGTEASSDNQNVELNSLHSKKLSFSSWNTWNVTLLNTNTNLSLPLVCFSRSLICFHRLNRQTVKKLRPFGWKLKDDL